MLTLFNSQICHKVYAKLKNLSMRFLPPLEPALLIKRYKRFLADVILTATGETLTVHCPNSGRMTGIDLPGTPIWIRRSLNPNRKLAYTWEISQENETLVGVNTQTPNLLIAEALVEKTLEPFKKYAHFKQEVPYGAHSRLDFLLTDPHHPPFFLEVKNVHLNLNGSAAFPDSVTLRGTKHLNDLICATKEGYEAGILFLVQRSDLNCFTVAEKIDPVYAMAFQNALNNGVKVFCFRCNVRSDGISIGASVSLNL